MYLSAPLRRSGWCTSLTSGPRWTLPRSCDCARSHSETRVAAAKHPSAEMSLDDITNTSMHRRRPARRSQAPTPSLGGAPRHTRPYQWHRSGHPSADAPTPPGSEECCFRQCREVRASLSWCGKSPAISRRRDSGANAKVPAVRFVRDTLQELWQLPKWAASTNFLVRWSIESMGTRKEHPSAGPRIAGRCT